MSPWLIALLACGQVSEPSLTGQQLAAVLSGLYAEPRDVSFVYEGAFTPSGPAAGPSGGPSGVQRYQGYFIYRNDRAGNLDIYIHNEGEELPLIRIKRSFLGTRFETLDLEPDRAAPRQVEVLTNSSLANLDFPGSPLRLLLGIRLGLLIESYPSLVLSDQAWESVDGHRCLAVTIDRMPESKSPTKRTTRYWIDLDRGGIVLRSEMYQRRKLLMRTVISEVTEEPLPGDKKLWLPTAATTETFLWENAFYDEPVTRETYRIPRSSVRVNVGRPDSVFSVTWSGTEGEAPELAPLRQEFADLIRRPRKPALRSDPASVRQRLEAQLADADRQARQLEASRPASLSQQQTRIYQAIFASVGLGLLGYVALRLRAGGRP
jgi:hypothetical protein